MSKKKAPARADRRRSTWPDYGYWAGLKTLRSFEAAALSLDSDPDEFGPATGKSIEEALQFPNFQGRLRAIERQVGNAEGISPANLVAWMDEHSLKVPEGLRAAVHPSGDEKLRAEAAVWKRKYIQLKNKKDERSRDRLVVGLAMAHHGWKPNVARGGNFASSIELKLASLAARAQADDVWQTKIEVGRETIRKQIEAAYRRLAELDDEPLGDLD